MDRGPNYNHGFSESDWRLAKEQARAAMIKRAKLGGTMTYTDLCDPRLAHFLGEISTEEDAAGRGMLTAVVVHKHDRWPGAGFFELAQSLGRRVSDPEKVWIAELDKLRAAHADGA
jgi:hypothetical protein